ncbi:surface anchored protein [Streptococcus pneumoniae]|nr:surface anchored protein [Streptococcus pneumoniae]
MKKSYRDDNGEKIFRYSIRKYHFGAASVAVAALMFFANGAVAASETITPATASDVVTAGSDGNADGDSGASDEGESKKTLTSQPAELKPADEVKGQEASAEETNQGQAGADSNTTGAESNSAQSETNPANQEATQAGEVKEQDQPAAVANTEVANSTQGNLQALLEKLTLSSMQELHAEVEARLAAAKAVLEDPKATQAQVDEQARLMAELTSRVNQALTPALENPTILEKAGLASTDLTSTGLTSTGLATPDGAVTEQPTGGKRRRGGGLSAAAPDENQVRPSAGGNATTPGASSQATPRELPTYTNTEGKNGVYGLKDELEFITEQLRANGASADKIQAAKAAADKFNEAFSKGDTISQSDFDAALADLKKSRELIEGVLREKDANAGEVTEPVNPAESATPSENNVTIQPRTNTRGWSGFRNVPAGVRTRAARSIEERSGENRVGPGSYFIDKYTSYFDKGDDSTSPYDKYTYVYYNVKRQTSAGKDDPVVDILKYLREKVTKVTADPSKGVKNGIDWEITVNPDRKNLQNMSFFFTLPKGQSLVRNSFTITRVTSTETRSFSSPGNGNDDEITASLKAAGLTDVRKGTPERTNAPRPTKFLNSVYDYEVSTLNGLAKQGVFFQRGHESSDEVTLGNKKFDQIEKDTQTVYYGQLGAIENGVYSADPTAAYKITFRTEGSNKIPNLSYLSGIKGVDVNSGGNPRRLLVQQWYARTPGEVDSTDKFKFDLTGNHYYPVNQNTVNSKFLSGYNTYQVTKDGITYKNRRDESDQPYNSRIDGVISAEIAAGQPITEYKYFDITSYGDYFNENGVKLEKEREGKAEATKQGQTWHLYRVGENTEISKEDLTRDAILTPGVHAYKYVRTFTDGSSDSDVFYFVTKPKTPTLDTDLSKLGTVNPVTIKASGGAANSKMVLYRKLSNGNLEEVTSATANASGVATFTNVTLPALGTYLVKTVVDGHWLDERNNGEKHDTVESDPSNERDTLKFEMGVSTGNIPGTQKPNLKDEKVIPYPANDIVTNNSVKFIARSSKNIKKLVVTGAENIVAVSEWRTEGLNSQEATIRIEKPNGFDGNKRGVYELTVTATAEDNSTSTYKTHLFIPPTAGRFETTNDDLREKSNSKPQVTATGFLTNTATLPGYEWKAYLVKGGQNNPNSYVQEAQNYTVVAATNIQANGKAVFNESDYRQTEIGTDNLRLVTALVKTGTDQVFENLNSSLSESTIKATVPRTDYAQKPGRLTFIQGETPTWGNSKDYFTYGDGSAIGADRTFLWKEDPQTFNVTAPKNPDLTVGTGKTVDVLASYPGRGTVTLKLTYDVVAPVTPKNSMYTVKGKDFVKPNTTTAAVASDFYDNTTGKTIAWKAGSAPDKNATSGQTHTATAIVTYPGVDRNGQPITREVTTNYTTVNTVLVKDVFTATQGGKLTTGNDSEASSYTRAETGSKTHIQREEFVPTSRTTATAPSTAKAGSLNKEIKVTYDNGQTQNLGLVTSVTPSAPTITSDLHDKAGLTNQTITVSNVPEDGTVEVNLTANGTTIPNTTVRRVGSLAEVTVRGELPAGTIKASTKVTNNTYSYTEGRAKDIALTSPESDAQTSTYKLATKKIYTVKDDAANFTASDYVYWDKNGTKTALPQGTTVTWVRSVTTTTAGEQNYQVTVRVPNQADTTLNVPVKVYDKVTLKAPTHTNAKGKLANGTDAANYVNGVTQGVTVAWRGGQVPDVSQANPNLKGNIEVSYATDDAANPIKRNLQVSLPTYSATQTIFTKETTVGTRFDNPNTYDNYTHDYPVPGNRAVKSYWESRDYRNSIRDASATTLGKVVDKIKVYFPNADGNIDYNEDRRQELAVTFIVKPKTPSIDEASVSGKAEKNNQTVRINNVTPGTTVELYNGDTKIGSVDVPKAGNETDTSTKTANITVNGVLPYTTNLRAKTIYQPNNPDQNVASDFSASVRSTTQAPQAPTVSQSPEDLIVKSEVGQDGATKATLTYINANGETKTVGFTKHGDYWDKDNANADTTVSIINGTNGRGEIQIQPDTARAGSTVTVVQNTDKSAISAPGTTRALGRLNGLTNTAQADGSVEIRVPEAATRMSLTYTPQGQTASKTLEYTKTGSTWTSHTGTETYSLDRKIIIPKANVADGSTVSVIASNDNSTTTTVVSKAKFEQPSGTTSTTRQNGDVEVTLPTDAEKVTLTYKNKQNTNATVTLAKEGTNWTSSTNLPDGVSLANGKVTLDYTKVNRDTNITTASTRGKGDVESQANNQSYAIPEHTAPTTQNVVIAAGATPTNEQLATGVTVATKQSVVAKDPLTAVAAGTTKVVATTLTYQDGSSETVNVTVISKPTAPTVNDLENRPNASGPGLLSTARKISGTAMAGAEKVKLTLQNGDVKEITPEANGSWSYTLAANEFLTQTTSRFNAKYSSDQVKVVQVKNNVESEATNVGVVMGRAIVDTPLQAGRKITVHIPHDMTSGYIRIGGTTSTGGVDIGLKKVGDTWILSTDADKANKLELVNEADPTNPAMTKLTLKVKDTDAALYSSPFTIGSDRGNVKFRAHYYNGGNINGPVPSGRTSDLDWILSETPTNTVPTVSWQTGKEVQDGQKIPSPTVDELKDLFKGADVEDDASLTVGYAASNRGKLRVRVFTGRDTARNIEGTSVSAQANGRIAPGTYTLVLSTRDAAGAESNLLERNVVIQSHADYYRDTVKYPRTEEKVTYNDTAITNGNFTTAAKTSFKDKIQELNRTALPTTTTYTAGNTDDKAKVAVINFPDGSTIDISHAVVAKPEVPTITPTHGDKVSDADRTISGTALQNATKVTIHFQDGRGTEGHVDVTPVNGKWTYTLPSGRYLRQTEQSSLPGSSTVPLSVTQTVFDAVSDAKKVYVAKDRNFEGKAIVGKAGDQELTNLKNDPRLGIKYTERNVPKDFPSDFSASWKETPNITEVGTRTYIAKVFEANKADAVAQEIEVEVTVKAATPDQVVASHKQNGDAVLTPPTNADKVTITYTNKAGAQETVKLSKEGQNWSVTEGEAGLLQDGKVVLGYKDIDRSQAIQASATAGSDKYLSDASSTQYTVPEHSVTITPITRAQSDSLQPRAIEDAVTVDNKASVVKKGDLPESIGKNKIAATVTYDDQSTEDVEIPYTIKPDAPSVQTSIGKVGATSVTVNGVTPGTTVVLYDVSNPTNPRELGRKDITGTTGDAKENGVDVTVTTLTKDQKIAAKVIYKPTSQDERTESDLGESLTVREGLAVNSIHAIKGEAYTGEAKGRIRYNDNTDEALRTNLPDNATVEWKDNQAPDYNAVGTRNYTAVVTIPGQGSTEVEVPVHVYPTASLKKSSYNNKVGTLSNGAAAENYVKFEGTDTKPNNVTVRWKDGTPDLSTASADRKAVIEVVYPGNASSTDTVVKELEVSLPTYHSEEANSEYTLTIGDNFNTNAKNYVTTSPTAPQGTEYAWKTDGTANQEYGSDTWGGVNGDWIGKKTNKVKVYYPNADGGNEKSEALAEETQEITFIKKPAKPSITTDLEWKSGTRSVVEVGNVTSGTRVVLYDEQGNELGHTDVPKGTDYATATTTTITPTKDLPKGKVYVKTIYMPDNQAEKVESDKSDDVTAKLNALSAKGSIQTLAGSGNIVGTDTLDAQTLGKLLRQENAGVDFTGATAQWKDKTALEKGVAGTRVETLLVKLKGQTENQEVQVTVTTLAQPSAKAVLKEKDANITNDNLSNYVTAEGNGTLSWENDPAEVKVGQSLPRIKVTYPQNGVALTDITDQYITPSVYSLEAKADAKTTVTVGDTFNPQASDYVVPVANTSALPNGTTYTWKDGNAPTSATVGKANYTVVTRFGTGTDVPEELRGQSVETTVEITVLSQKPSQPALAQDRTSLEITAVVGKEDSRKAELRFTDAAGQEQTVSFTKGTNGQWDKDDANAQPTVQITNNVDGTATVHMTSGTAKVGTTVYAKQKKDNSEFSEEGSLVAKDRLNGVNATTKADGSVDVTVPQEADKARVTYTPEGETSPKTVEITKQADGNWSLPQDSGLELRKDDATGQVTVTVPADKVKDGTKVTGDAESATKLSEEKEATAKAPQPNEFSEHVRDNGDVEITIPENADSATINYPVSDTEIKTVTLTKEADGRWTAPQDSGITITNPQDNSASKVTVPSDKISGNRTITATAKAGTGTGESTQRDFTTTVPEHPKPTVAEVTVAAGATPTAEQINAAITATKKQNAVAKGNLTPVGAGTSATVKAVVTYADGSTEEVDVTVNSKTATPDQVVASHKQNGDAVLTPPTNADKVTITYTNKAGAQETVKLSKEGQNWSVTEGEAGLLQDGKVVLGYKDIDRSQAIQASATAGSDKYLSDASSTQYTVPEHSVTTNTLVKPYKQNVTDNDLLDAVNAEHKQTVNLKDGTSYPTTDGFHDIELTVTYEDGSTENVPAKYKVTDASKGAIDKAAETKKDEIDKRTDLTKEEKDKAKSDVETAAKDAKKAIDDAATNDKVDEAKNNGHTAIDNINPTGDKKSDAKKEIDQAAKAKKDEIDKRTDLTKEEKDKAKTDVDTAVTVAKKAIDDATTNDKVDEAKNNGKQAIDNINPQPAPRPNPTPRPDDSANTNSGTNADNGANTNNGGTTTPADSNSNSVTPDNSGNTPVPGVTTDDSSNTNPVTPSSTVGQAQASTPAQETPVSTNTPNNSGDTATPSETRPVDKSELARLVEELETRLKDLDGIDQSVIDAAKIILGEGQEALRNAHLTEAGLREVTAKVKESLESLKGKQATKDEEEMQETSKEQGHLPYGTMIGSLLALLGLLLFLIARRKKESELKKLTKELTKVLQESDLTNVDAKVLDQAREALAQAVAFLANEKESDHTEDELIEKLKAILAQLR